MTDGFLANGYRDMAHVPRWVIARTTRTQYLAEHSYFVAIYARQIAVAIGWQGDYGALLHYALIHDLEETITGDMPGPMKRRLVDKAEEDRATRPLMRRKFGQEVLNSMTVYSDDIKKIVKVADSCEELAFIYEQVDMGNRWMACTTNDAQLRLRKRVWELDIKNKEELFQKVMASLSNTRAIIPEDPA